MMTQRWENTVELSHISLNKYLKLADDSNTNANEALPLSSVAWFIKHHKNLTFHIVEQNVMLEISLV